MIADLLLISTDPSVSVGNRLAIGWLIIVIMSLSIIASTGSAVLDSLKETKLKCKKYNSEREAKKKAKKN